MSPSHMCRRSLGHRLIVILHTTPDHPSTERPTSAVRRGKFRFTSSSRLLRHHQVECIYCATWNAVQCFALSSVSKAARLIKKYLLRKPISASSTRPRPHCPASACLVLASIPACLASLRVPERPHTWGVGGLSGSPLAPRGRFSARASRGSSLFITD